jgi:hypothetical protein
MDHLISCLVAMFKAYEKKSKPDNVETVTKDTAK